MFDGLRYWLSDMVPYSVESWVALVSHYNSEQWPSHLLTLPLLFLILWLGRSDSGPRQSLLIWILCIGWLWIATIFHQSYFVSLTWAAEYYGWLFIIQAVLLVLHSIFRRKSAEQGHKKPISTDGLVLTLAVLILPLTQLLYGQPISSLGWVAMTPDSTALVTIAILGYIQFLKVGLVIVPLLWGIVAFANAWALNYVPGMAVFPFMIVLLVVFKSKISNQAIREI